MDLFKSILEATLMAIGLITVAHVCAFAIVEYLERRRSKRFKIKVTLKDNNDEEV